MKAGHTKTFVVIQAENQYNNLESLGNRSIREREDKHGKYKSEIFYG